MILLLRKLKAWLRRSHAIAFSGRNLMRELTMGDRTFRIALGNAKLNMAYAYPPGGDYEPWLRKFLRLAAAFAGDDKSAIDAGANMGIFTIVLAALLPKGTVIAFEPVQTMHKFLVENLERNAIVNVITEQAALTATNTETLHINIAQQSEAGGSFISPAAKPAHFPGTYPLPVESVSMDAYLKRIKKPLDIKILKLDVEGWEAPILAGAGETIARHDPITFLEFNVARRGVADEKRGGELFAAARALFKHLYLINRLDEKLQEISSYAELRACMLTGHFVEDLLCFNDSKLKHYLRDEIQENKLTTYGAAEVQRSANNQGMLIFLSRYPDGWCNGHDFAAAMPPGKYRLTLRNNGPHAKNTVFIVHGNQVRELMLQREPYNANLEAQDQSDDIIYIFSEKTFPAREFFNNDDPRELGIQIQLEALA